MKNQWGQEIAVGDVVGYVNKTGSHTERKIGKVLSFGERSGWTGIEATVIVNWQYSGHEARAIDETGRGCGISTVFKLDPESLDLTLT